MVDVEMTASADTAAGGVAEEPTKQQLQLAQFNEYIHLCRDLYKMDPTMVSYIAYKFLDY